MFRQSFRLCFSTHLALEVPQESLLLDIYMETRRVFYRQKMLI